LIKCNRQKGSGRESAKGYTLVELIAVCTIISILAAMSFALLSRMRSQAVETNALSALNTLATGYEMYYFYNSSYPQWGPGQRFGSPRQIFDYLVEEEFIPRSYSHYTYDQNTGYIYGFTQSYAVEIPQYNPITASPSSYFIVLRPFDFQRDSLAIGTSLPAGWVAARARRGPDDVNYQLYRLYVPHRGGAID
jgi:prepilin-type N-terminal cleavage/methylation domain-containing protein